MHDISMFRWNKHEVRRARFFDWEYWIGDKGYVGLPEVICEYKPSKNQPLTQEQLDFNRLLQFYASTAAEMSIWSQAGCGRAAH